MAENISITWFWEIVGKPDVRGGSKATPITFSLTNGTPSYDEKILADNYTADVLWTAGEGGKDTFELMMIVSDVAVFIGIRNDAGSPEYAVHQLAPNIPFILGSDDLYANTTDVLDGAILVDGTDYNQIDRIEVQRDVADGIGDAKVKIWVWS